jgi:putative transposase
MPTAQIAAFAPHAIDFLIEGAGLRQLAARNGANAAGKRGRVEDPLRVTTRQRPQRLAENRLVQPHLPEITERVTSLHARGYTESDIRDRLSSYFATPVAPSLVHSILSQAQRASVEWRERPLEASYPIIVFERIRVKGGMQSAKARYCHFAIGLPVHGPKEVIGVWLENNDDDEFWPNVLGSLKRRGVADALYLVGVDPSLAAAQRLVFGSSIPVAHVGELMRQSVDLAPSKDRGAIATELRAIHSATDFADATAALQRFVEGPLGQLYPAIGQIWQRNWCALPSFFDVAPEVRCVMTSTFAADGLRRAFKLYLRTCGRPLSDDDGVMLMYLLAQQSQRRWRRPQREWRAAKAQLALVFQDRFA